MNDLDGNVIPEGSIIIGKAPRSSGRTLERGVCMNGLMVSLNNGVPYRRSLSCVHWIKNPTKGDKKARREIMKGIYDHEHRKCVHLKEGYVYGDNNGHYYLYLGKRHLSVEIETGLGWMPLYENDGQFVYRLKPNQKKLNFAIMFRTSNKKPFCDISNAQFGWVEICKKVDLPEYIEQETAHDYGGMKDYTTRLILKRLSFEEKFNIEEENNFGEELEVCEDGDSSLSGDADYNAGYACDDENGDGEA